MSRDIKFRAWDTETNKYVEDVYIGDRRMPSNALDWYDFEQWTGLSDKNGKEIYEGDVYKQDTGFVGQIMFVSGGFAGGKSPKSCSPIGWIEDVGDEDEYTGDSSPCDRYSRTVEVIGTIHTHPHLLEGE